MAARTAFRVLGRPPSVRFTKPPRRAVVGRPLRVPFKLRHGVGAVAQVSSRGGVEFTRRYIMRRGTGFVEWTPRTAGRAVLHIRASGRDGQSTADVARIAVARAPRVTPPATVTILETPHLARVGGRYPIVFRASGCREAVARIDGIGKRQSVWRFRCVSRPLRFVWSPRRPGRQLLTISAHGRRGTTSQTTLPLTAERRR